MDLSPWLRGRQSRPRHKVVKLVPVHRAQHDGLAFAILFSGLAAILGFMMGFGAAASLLK